MRRVLCLLLCLLPVPALARGPVSVPPPSAQCEVAITNAERGDRLPRGVLTAIAQVESGRPDLGTGRLHPWPWTVNAEGAGQVFASKAQAIAAVQGLQARGIRSVDVGCTQINLYFHPAAFPNLEQAFDPQANARYAARYLNRLYADSHDWMQVVAAYHSVTPILGAGYRERVLALWRKPDLAGWDLGLAVAYRAFLPPDHIYADFAPTHRVYGAFANTGVSAAQR